jgi:tetratricopeptide (TPR) repeat protein
MIGFLKRFLLWFFDRMPRVRRRTAEGEIPETFWEADFSKPAGVPFDMKPENAYDVYLRGGSLGIGLKKPSCLVWTEGTGHRCRDLVLRARLKLDPKGGYGAAGVLFRLIDEGTYYLVLLSNKGYFRLDLVRNNMPLALIGWTEFGESPAAGPVTRGSGVASGGMLPGGVMAAELTIIAYGARITLLIDGLWAGEIHDSSIDAGSLGFALASYEAPPGWAPPPEAGGTALPEAGPAAGAGRAPPRPRGRLRGTSRGAADCVAEAFLEYLSVDTRLARVEAAWNLWNGGPPAAAEPGRPERSGTSPSVPGERRLRLAETFAAMGESAPALVQLKKLWEEGFERRGRDLLLAARIARNLELYDEAEEYLGACLAGDAGEGPEQGEARIEQAKLLHARKRYADLRDYVTELLRARGPDATLLALLGQAQWEVGNYEEAAPAYDRAFALDGENGLAAANAANAYELLGRRDQALDRYLAAGRSFLQADNYQDLGTLIPKLLALGPGYWEAHALAGKWAFGIEDWETAGREFDQAETLRRKAKTGTGEQDPALSYLRALLLIRQGKRRKALPLLEEAARLAPDYGLFRFRLAENRYLLDNDPAGPRFRADLERALSLLDPAAVREPPPAAGAEDAPRSGKPERPEPARPGPGEPGEPGGRPGPPRFTEVTGTPGETGTPDRAALPGEAGETWGWANNLAAQASLAAGDLEAAAKFLEQAAAALGEPPPVLVNRAVYHYLRGSLDQALAILDAAAAQDAEGSMANCAGNLLVRAKQFDRARNYYRRALARAPDNPEFLANQASCLIETGAYGEADTLLARAHNLAPSPAVLELITCVAVKKGEYPRAESACRAALELESGHRPSLHSLGWIYSSAGRWEEAGEILARLEALTLSGEDAERREDLRRRILDGTTRLIPCARCGRTWRVPLDPPPIPFLRILAMPPDELPAGTCAACGASYCIGCAKEHLDPRGRFTCPVCGRPLKLINEGLKKIVAGWAAEALPDGGSKS